MDECVDVWYSGLLNRIQINGQLSDCGSILEHKPRSTNNMETYPPERANINLPGDLKHVVDLIAEKEHRTRSVVIERALRVYVKSNKRMHGDNAFIEETLNAEG